MSVQKSKTPTKDGRSWIFKTRYINLKGENKYYTSKKFKTKREAIDAERLFLESLTEKFDFNDMNFRDLYNRYLDHQKEKVKLTTINSYFKRWEYFEKLENVKLKDFGSSHYELWRKELLTKRISDEYRNDIQKFLKILLNYGSKWYGMDFVSIYNKIRPFNDPNAPMKEEMKFFTWDEYRQFIQEEDNLLYKCAFDILYYCGLRRGEVIGLSWKNVNLRNKEIKIRDNAVRDYQNGGYTITTPKTKSSIRIIPLTDNLVNELSELKEERKKIYGFNENWFVLGYDNPMPFSTLRGRKNYLCEKAGVKTIRLHDFRHSCASLLISRGANITLVAKYLGHSKIDMTLNIYSHFFKSDLDSLVSSLNELNNLSSNLS